jgi:hypothetical protein
MSDTDTAQKLLSLALHPDTPHGEQVAAALGLARLVKKLRLLEGKQEPEKTRVVAQPPPQAAEPDAPMGPTQLGHLGWAWVRAGRSQFCRQCSRDKKKRGSNIISAGSIAAERKGEYAHEDCHRKWGG